MAKPSVQEALHNNELPIGLDMIHVENVSISLNHFRQLAYVSDNEEALQSITSHLLKVLMELPNPAKIMLLDTAGDYTHFKEDVRTYVGNEEELPDLVKQLFDIFERRQVQPLEEQEPWFIVIPNLQTFIQESGISEEDWVRLFNKAYQVKLYLILGGSYQYLGISGDAQVKKVRLDAQWFLVGMRLTDQSFLDKVYNSKEPKLDTDMVYIHNRKQYQQLKISS